jgi:hypothetical protein
VQVNYPALLTRIMRDGFQMGELDNIIETDFMKESTDPETENKIIKLGGEVDTSPSDEDDAHIQVHQKLAMDPKTDPYTRSVASEHIKEHINAKQKKMEAQQQQQMQMQMMAAQAAAKANKATGKQANPNAMPPNPMGNQGQLSQATDESNLHKGIRP